MGAQRQVRASSVEVGDVVSVTPAGAAWEVTTSEVWEGLIWWTVVQVSPGVGEGGCSRHCPMPDDSFWLGVSNVDH